MFSRVKCILGSQATVNLHVMRPVFLEFGIFSKENAPRRNRRKFQSWKTAISWPRSIVSKGDVGSCDSHLTKRVSFFTVKAMWSYVTDTSSKKCVTLVSKSVVRLWDSQLLTKLVWLCGMARVAYHRTPVEGLKVVKCCKRSKTIGLSETRRGTHGNFLACAQCTGKHGSEDTKFCFA